MTAFLAGEGLAGLPFAGADLAFDGFAAAFLELGFVVIPLFVVQAPGAGASGFASVPTRMHIIRSGFHGTAADGARPASSPRSPRT